MSDSASSSVASVLDLSLLTNTTWNVYSSSPLYRLQYTDIYLKKLAKWLREELAATIQEKNKLIISYKVIFEKISNINLTDEEAEALMITIIKLKEKRSSILYKGLFLSRGSKFKRIKNFKFLPTLLCKCSEHTATVVHSHLERLFDCKIYPVFLDKDSFKWLCVIFVSKLDIEDETSNMVTLTYNFKQDCDYHFSISQATLLDLWSCIQAKKSQEITETDVHQFFDTLENELKIKSQIDVAALNLQGLKMPKLNIKKPCKLKIADPFYMHHFLLFIQDFTVF